MAQRKSVKAPAGISFRASARERAMIDRAAQAKNVGPSDYARQSIMKQVEMDLADESEFMIPAKDMAAFMEALDRPAQVKPRLKKLLTEKSVLE
jgi:uncharacterized protein (DUF1778 family)